MKSPSYPVEDYTVHEITLGHSLQCSRLRRNHDRIYFNTSSFSGKRWTNEQPRIDIYIDQIITVSGVANSSGFALAALLNANIGMGNDPIIGIEAYPVPRRSMQNGI